MILSLLYIIQNKKSKKYKRRIFLYLNLNISILIIIISYQSLWNENDIISSCIVKFQLYAILNLSYVAAAIIVYKALCAF